MSRIQHAEGIRGNTHNNRSPFLAEIIPFQQTCCLYVSLRRCGQSLSRAQAGERVSKRLYE
eukprot:11463-Eustigmatos_ZCMA.PRE.1